MRESRERTEIQIELGDKMNIYEFNCSRFITQTTPASGWAGQPTSSTRHFHTNNPFILFFLGFQFRCC